jgi:molybdenum cofactor biosynthesis enzyme MoaA
MQEIWNSEVAQKIRESVHDGSFSYCISSRCPHLQSVSGPVQKKEAVTDSEMLDVIGKRLTIMPKGPRTVRCSYDMSCNLSCPTCRTELIIEKDRKHEILAINQTIRETWLPDARSISITGSGDPFGSPYFRHWLQTMRRDEMPQIENLHLSSNAVMWTRHHWELIPADIRELILSTDISIDAATPETYAINRRNGKYERLLENLEFISTLRRNGPLKYVMISFVVQDNNFLEMPDFVRLGMKYGFDSVYFGQLLDWGTFTEDEFKRRAVHFPGHPRHADLIRVLSDDIFASPIADLGNLTEIARRARCAQH